MLDLRPVGNIIGLLVALLGATMVLPMSVDLMAGHDNWRAFALSGFLSVAAGLCLWLACGGATTRSAELRPTLRQTFLLTVLVWVALPFAGALPLHFGEPRASWTDAFFEAMSGLTTTGATVLSGLEDMPRGVLLWRGMMQWFGGIGIVIVAMAFLPALRVGGMQMFKSEAFDTFGKILPRAGEIATSVSWVYVALTAGCGVAYAATGMAPFDALVHAMTTVSTGGMATNDASFAALPPTAEYVASVFMALAALPFVRLVQLVAGFEARAILNDTQVRGFALVLVSVIGSLAAWRLLTAPDELVEETLRQSIFNSVSIITGTGYASVDYQLWGAFPAALLFVAGLVGGCAGSTSCSIKVFRYQVVFAAVGAQITRIHAPHAVAEPRWAGRRVDDDTIASVMAFFFLFLLTLAVVSVTLSMLGLDTVTAISGAASALANVGPGLGDVIGPAGNFAPLSDAAKWVLSGAMLLGRLELMAVFVLFTAAFWRD